MLVPFSHHLVSMLMLLGFCVSISLSTNISTIKWQRKKSISTFVRLFVHFTSFLRSHTEKLPLYATMCVSNEMRKSVCCVHNAQTHKIRRLSFVCVGWVRCCVCISDTLSIGEENKFWNKLQHFVHTAVHTTMYL